MCDPLDVIYECFTYAYMRRSGSERKRQRLLVTEKEERMGRVFLAYGTLLTEVNLLKYLGRMFSSFDENRLAVEQNLRRLQINWGRLVKLLRREGAYRRKAGRFYVVVVKAVLLFESETRELPPPEWIRASRVSTTRRYGG